jgi:hypothetical protein
VIFICLAFFNLYQIGFTLLGIKFPSEIFCLLFAMNTSQFSFINFDDEIDAQQLFNDFKVMFKAYNKVSRKLKDAKPDKESLANKLSESHVLIDSLKSEKESLANDLSKSHILIDSLNSEMSLLVKKNISLENDLKDSKELSQKFSSDNLKSFFCVDNKQSMIVDNVGSSTSRASKSKRKTLFVKPVNVKEVKANIVYLDKGKNSCLNNCVKPISKTSSKKQTQAKFVPTCHHCGIIGHITPNCF